MYSAVFGIQNGTENMYLHSEYKYMYFVFDNLCHMYMSMHTHVLRVHVSILS